ncbi:hypothetical protein ACQEVB_38920 [Pseudonocardia sp. CA-107938]|uniref:hypothetical protein n=1 Tax=Pseudonocardia sp. CA-107938 TaxID=3240021 RepID=UPI003D8D999D
MDDNQRVAVSDTGIRIGPVDESGIVRNAHGARIGELTPDGEVVDLAGMRIGRAITCTASATC